MTKPPQGSLKEFYTRFGKLPVSKDDPVRELPTFNGNNWQTSFVPDFIDDYPVPHKYLVHIHAKNRQLAQQALELIVQAACLFGDVNPVNYETKGGLYAYDEDYVTELLNDGFQHDAGILFLHSSYATEACQLAAKASFRKRYKYALAKYWLSMSLYFVHPLDFNPEYRYTFPLSSFPLDHVRLAHAIISAYSVIEEIGLEIRAGKHKPAFKDGAWNPVVLKDLQQRLTNSGIDLSKHYVWTARGSYRRIEKERPPKYIGHPPWNLGIQVRDGYVTVEDAIAIASWLRSRVASHRFSELASSLSPYDLTNVQVLARRLFLEHLGLLPTPKTTPPRDQYLTERRALLEQLGLLPTPKPTPPGDLQTGGTDTK